MVDRERGARQGRRRDDVAILEPGLDLAKDPGALEHRLLQRHRTMAGASVHLAQEGLAHLRAELRHIAPEARVPEGLRQNEPDRLGAGEIIGGRLDDGAEPGEDGKRSLAGGSNLAGDKAVAEEWPPGALLANHSSSSMLGRGSISRGPLT